VTLAVLAMADPEISKGGAPEDDVSAPSSFIANAHNELHAFYTRKGGLLKKHSELVAGAHPSP